MNNTTCTGRDCLTGVGCDVTACQYNGHDAKCHANSITIESKTAMKKGETFCSTFTPKSNHTSATATNSRSSTNYFGNNYCAGYTCTNGVGGDSSCSTGRDNNKNCNRGKDL